MKLKDRVAIVTGAASGIGTGIAEVFALENGARVVVSDRNADQGQRVVTDLQAKGATAKFVPCDVADEAQVQQLVQATLDEFGRIDVLVNNAGVNFVKPFDQLTSEDWDRVTNVDLRGVFLCTRACIGSFLNQGSGNVITIASTHTTGTLPGAAPYAASKWGVVGMMKSLACEYAAKNLRFNCISPGLIDTQIWQDIQDAADDKEVCRQHWWANIPAGRVASPQEMGRVAAFLASDDASYVNGSNVYADGGMTSQLISREQFTSSHLEGR